MPGFLAQLGGVAQCFHTAPIKPPVGSPRVLLGLSKMPALSARDVLAVTGCPFQIPFGVGTKPQPCVIVVLDFSSKVFIDGAPALLANPNAKCVTIEGIPQGLPLGVVQTQVAALF